MASDAIQYLNRYTAQVETEDIYGGGILRWVYGHPLGRLSLHALVKRAIFSRWYGWRMNRPASRRKVLPFIDSYQIARDELADAPESFRTFNEFFYRKLKPAARPVSPDPAQVVFPADGRHLGFDDISKIDGIFVKGQKFALETLLQDAVLTDRFQRGAMVLSRLCPVDYHRFHFPVAGLPDQPRLISGPLFSVSPIALRRNIHILALNRRALSRIESEGFGQVLMLEVGATNVGSFVYTFQPGIRAEKGEEKGYFKFGGSLVITLFEPGRIRLAPDLVETSKKGMELYARMGDGMAHGLDARSAQSCAATM